MSKGGGDGDASAASGQATHAVSSILPLAAAAAIAVVVALAGMPFLDGMAPAAHAQQYDNGDCAQDLTDCIFRFTDTPVVERPGTGQFDGASLIRFDPASNRLYIAYDNVVAVYNASSPGHPLMFNATFPGGPDEPIDAMEVNTRTGDLYVATRIGGYSPPAGTTYLFKMNSSGSVSNVTFTTPYFQNGNPHSPAPFELRVDSERSLVYMSTAWPRNAHGITDGASANGIVVLNATGDPPTHLPFGRDVNGWRNTYNAWYVSSMAVNSTALNHTIVYAMAYYFDPSGGGFNVYKVALLTLRFNGGGGGVEFDPHYTQIDRVLLRQGSQNAKNDWLYNAYDMVLDDRNDKLFVLMERTGELRWYDLKNRTSGPNGLPTLGGTLETTPGFNRDLVLDEGRGLLYWITSDSVGVYRTSDGVRLALVDRPGIDSYGYPGPGSDGYPVYAKGHAAVVDAVPDSAALPAGMDAGDIDTGIVYVLGPMLSNLTVIDPRPESAPERLARDVADGGTVAIPDGTYRDVYLSTGAGGAEKAMTIRPASGEAGGVVFTGASHIRVRNGDVAVQGIVFRDTTCHDKLEDADRADGYLPEHVVNVDANATRIANVTITDSVFENTCYGGILSGGLDGPGSGNASDIVIRNNTFRDIGYNARHHGGVPEEPRSAIRTGVYSGGVQMQNATISSNTFEGIAWMAVDVRQARNITVSNNTIADTPHSAIRIHGGSDGVEVRGNKITNASYAPNFDYLRGVNGSAALAQDAAILVVPDDGGLLGRTDNVNATGNDISLSGGAFSVCGAVCKGNASAGYATTIGSDSDSIVGPDGQDIRFNWNTVHMDNGDRLVENGVRGALDARYNYYPGYEPAAGLFRAGAQASGNLPAGTVLYEPRLMAAPGDRASVLRVASANASGGYGAGDQIDITVEFTKPVVVEGTPVLTIDAGPVDRSLDMTQHDASVLTFRYAVVAGDSSPALEYANRSSLAIGADGGSIADLHTGAPANLTLPAMGSSESLSARGLVVGTPDTTAPTVLSVTSESEDGTYRAGELVEVEVVFSENVFVGTGGGTPSLLLDTGGQAGSPAGYARGSGTETLVFGYRPAQGDASGDLDYVGTDSLRPNGGTIADRVRNAANLTLPEPGGPGSLGNSSNIAIDAVPPRVVSVSSPDSSGAYTVGAKINITVTFGEDVYVTGAPTLALSTSPARSASYVEDTDGDAALEFLYTVQPGDGADRLDYAGNGALSLGDGEAIKDAAGNDAVRNLPPRGGSDSLAASGIAIDTVPPAVLHAEAEFRDRIRVTFDGPVSSGAMNTSAGWSISGPSAGRLSVADLGPGAPVDNIVLVLDGHLPDTAPVLALSYNASIGGIADAAGNMLESRTGIDVADGIRPDVVEALITGPREVTIDYTEPVAASPDAYSNLDIGGDVRAIDPHDTSALSRHVLGFSGAEAPIPEPPSTITINGSMVRDEADNLLDVADDHEEQILDGRILGVYSSKITDPDTVVITYTRNAAAEREAYSSLVVAGQPRNITDLVGGGGEGHFHTITFSPDDAPPNATGSIDINGTAVMSLSSESDMRLGRDTIRADLSDGQSPSALSAAAVSIDTIRVSFDEAILAPGTGASGWSVSGGDAAGIAVASSRDASDPSNTLTLTLSSPLPDTAPDSITLSYHPAAGSVEDPAGNPLVASSTAVDDGIAPVVRSAVFSGPNEAEVRYTEPVWASPGAYASISLSSGGDPRPVTGLVDGNGTAVHTLSFGGEAAGQGTTGTLAMDATAVRDAAMLPIGPNAMLSLSLAGEAPPPVRPGEATARAVFATRNTVAITYSAPLGPPAGHSGPVYAEVAINGQGGGVRPVSGVSGLGTAMHTVEFGGAGVNGSQTGTITLAVGLGGAGEGDDRPRFAAGAIPVASGRTIQTVLLSQPQQGTQMPVRIEPDGFTRTVDGTAAGDSARLAINVTGLAQSSDDPGTAVFPAEAVTLAASFARVTFPPGVTATSVPTGGAISLYVDADTAENATSALGYPAAGTLTLRTIVEVGGSQAPVLFDMPVRILLEGQAGGRAFYIEGGAGGAAAPIDLACAADDTVRVHRQLGGMGECRIESGSDLVIHTYHLTRFGTVVSDRGTPPPVVHTCSLRLDKADLAVEAVLGGYSKAVRQAVVNSGSQQFDRVALDATPWYINPSSDVPGPNAPSLPASLTVESGTAQGGPFAPLPGAVADGLGGGEEEPLWLAINLTGHAQVNGTRLVQDVAYTAECGG